MNAGRDAVWAALDEKLDTQTLVPGRWHYQWEDERADTAWLVRDHQRTLDDLDTMLDTIINPENHPENLGPT